jgi:hypothetical protein
MTAEPISERMLPAQSEPPPSGWRRLLFRLTGGVLNTGTSAADREAWSSGPPRR